MTRARFFLAAAVVAALSAADATAVMAQSAAPYAAAIDKAHVVSAQSSARTTETNRVQNTVTPATSPKPAPASAVTPRGGTATPPQTAEATAPDSTGFTYDPQGRRDPFVSLLRRGNDESAQSAGPRKPGLPGLGVGEVTLKGTMASRGGYLALLRGADAKTYIVRPGDRLLDGSVQAVTADAVVILQQVNDPLSPQKEREVRKMLRQTEEEAK